MQLVKVFKPKNYAEDFQKRPCKFAFARLNKAGNFRVLVDPALCRDFLGDTLVWKAKENTDPGDIYGWNYRGYVDPKKVCLYIEDTRHSWLLQNQPFLNQLEMEIGLKTFTSVTDLGEGKNLAVLADKWWMTTTVHFSFYTYLLRQLTYDTHVKDWGNFVVTGPGEQLTDSILQRFHLMLTKLKFTQVAGTAAKWVDSDSMHSFNGFASQFSNPMFCEYAEQLRELSKS